MAERFDLAVVAEGGVFGEQTAWPLSHDYAPGRLGRQLSRWTAARPGWRSNGSRATALRTAAVAADAPGGTVGAQRAALVWCVPRDDDPVRELDDAQRMAVLNTVFDARVGRVAAVSRAEAFSARPGSADARLVRGRQVRIGNAAQTLHPVAGQGLNLGLRDAFALASALRDALDANRTALRPTPVSTPPCRAWPGSARPTAGRMIATTDFLARSFTWQRARPRHAARRRAWPCSNACRREDALARQMMFGCR